MTPSQDVTDTVRRRTFIGGAAAAVAAGTVAQATPAAAQTAPALTAAVLEFRDQWTGATGLAELLRRAGMTVVDLDLTRPATGQPTRVDLIAFGSFTNNARPYLDYVAAQTASLRDFVAAGGTVLELTQSDQFGPTVAYLPDTMSVQRTDPDSSTIHPIAADHPLLAGLRTSGGLIFPGRTGFPTSYENLGEWRGVRVLAAVEADGAPPALVEGAHGAGRFVAASLTVDKCWDATGTARQSAEAIADSEAFFANVAAYVGTVRAGTARAVVPTPMPPQPPTGPLIGHVDESSARIWARPGVDPAEHPMWTCTLAYGRQRRRTRALIATDRDDTLLFDVTGLKPGTEYIVEIAPDGEAGDLQPMRGSFTTAPPAGRPTVTTMGFGSCAPSVPDAVWDRARLVGCDGFVLLGDTPYVDSTNLGVARQKHRVFLQQPQLAGLISSMPVWGTWDDHDFGGNDVHGDLVGKANNRRAFADYRANASFGHGSDGAVLTSPLDGEGIYTHFRRGPVEVFLLDPRWFSRTEPSWADPAQPTCLGTVQWDWFRTVLSESDAPFKAIATGLIWDDKQNSEKDDWGTYFYEREAIFDFIRDEQIAGCFLMGGDIHVSRALNYGPRVGYDLWQFIVSPLHGSTIPSLNVPHPALVHSAVEPNVFLKLVADTTVKDPTLTATWINRAGREIFAVERVASQMGH
ncbi:alkaline phosphatase D family protein [Jiangella alba]|uniref:Phosphodiesterase/alkaline phosphatase D n=1 Tax=Jiangella alba TaxID=561176 RepID=A0A1H5JCD7_9ACTN|nr:alkaline phosphatase D family protein [Jiangella alba]SEE50124.1 Phosphodiesterase/alkaline phosphatase D [Jiangella alba]